MMTAGDRGGRQDGADSGWARAAESRWAQAIACAWGFAEATLFFVVPDVWIGLLALFGWRPGLRAAGSAVAGAVAGGAVMHAVGTRFDRDRSARLLAAVPAVSPEMVARVEGEMARRGPAGMLLGPLRGTPYKLYARAAGVLGQPLGAVLAWTVPARGIRFVLTAVAAALFGRRIRRATARPGWRVGPYLLAWVIFYVAYFRKFGP